jgi:choline dehydrogenase-like flavoprotein
VQSKHGAFVSRGPHLFVDDVDCPYVTPTDKPFTWIRSRQVGGRSLVWGGTSLRFSRYEFEASRREGIGTPWPFSYDELAPCYETVERFMGLTGEPAGLSQLPDSVFTFAPPPLTRSEKDLQAWTSSYARDCAAVPVRWIDSDARYAGWPRLSTPGSTLASAYQTGRLEVRANAVAREVVIDRRAGRATGVQYVGAVDGKECTVRGRVVLLCAGTIESTRLLLLSGVGERSDALGRFLMDHPVVSLNGTLLRDGIEPGHGFSARQRGLLIPRFQNLGDRAEGFRGGFGVWASFQRGSVDGRGLALLAAQGEMVPSGENVVSLSDEVDRWGIPVPRIECSYTDNDAAMRRAQLAFLGDICDAFAIATDRGKWNHSLPGGNVHELGTARLGADPETSALGPQQCRLGHSESPRDRWSVLPLWRVAEPHLDDDGHHRPRLRQPRRAHETAGAPELGGSAGHDEERDQSRC